MKLCETLAINLKYYRKIYNYYKKNLLRIYLILIKHIV